MFGEDAVDWSKNSVGRTNQLRRQLRDFQKGTERFATTLTKRKAGIAKLEGSTKFSIDSAAEAAYQALESIVSTLLTVEQGSRRLSRENTAITAALEGTISRFDALASLSNKCADELGVSAGDCSNLSQKAKTFIDHLKEPLDALNQQAPAIWTAKTETEGSLWAKQERERQLRSQLENARSERDSFGSKILGLFSDETKSRLDRDVTNAEAHLNENLAQQKGYRDKISLYQELNTLTKDTASQIVGLQARIRTVAEEFESEYDRLLTAQHVEGNLFRGLLKLRNQIWDTNFTSTRDTSLYLIIQLLAADDDVFQRKAFYEDTEARIKAAISAKLRSDSLERLRTLPQSSMNPAKASLL